MLFCTHSQPHFECDGGGGFFHSKGTWGCAAHKGILFGTSSLAKGMVFDNFGQMDVKIW